jgi:uncharacterized protein YneF (UPF0154 family)
MELIIFLALLFGFAIGLFAGMKIAYHDINKTTKL